MMFLYTFEPQINTLHPAVEQNTPYARSTRHGCELTRGVEEAYGFGPPSALCIITEASKCLTVEAVVEMFFCLDADPPRYMNCNLTLISEFLKAVAIIDSGEAESRAMDKGAVKKPGKPTIEFRQHQGTLDPERICAWVKLLMGIVAYCRDVDQLDFLDLVTEAAFDEKWSVGPNREDNNMNRARYGPVPAESTFTIIDLLTSICLDDSVINYYNVAARRHPLVDKNEHGLSESPPVVVWDYEARRHELSAEECEDLHSKRKIWESFQAIALAERDNPLYAASTSFDPEHEKWPAHSKYLDLSPPDSALGPK